MERFYFDEEQQRAATGILHALHATGNFDRFLAAFPAVGEVLSRTCVGSDDDGGVYVDVFDVGEAIPDTAPNNTEEGGAS